MELARGHDITTQHFDQRIEELTTPAYPIGQRRAFQFDSGPGIDLRLAIQRKMITVLRDQHMSQQSRPGQPARDRPARCRCLHDLFTVPAAQLRPYMPDNMKVCRHILQHLRDVFAQRTQFPAASRTGLLFRHMGTRDSRQVAGQRPPRGFLVRNSIRGCTPCAVRRRLALRLLCLHQIFQSQLQLFDLPLQLLRLASELHPLQLGQQQFQMLDLTLSRLQPLRGRAIALVDFHQERAQ